MPRRNSYSTGVILLSLAAVFPVDHATGQSAQGEAVAGHVAGVSIASLGTKIGALGGEATLELRNGSSAPVFYIGHGLPGVSYERRCLRDGQWHEDNMGACGVGDSPKPRDSLPASGKVPFDATLCKDGSPTSIGASIGTQPNERGTVVWSDPIVPPQLTDFDPMPPFHLDEDEVTVRASAHLKKRGALRALGVTWKLQAPEVAGVQVSVAEARACVQPGRYAIAHYPYIAEPADGPNSIVFEKPLYAEWKWIGDLEAMTMEQAISDFRAGKLCD